MGKGQRDSSAVDHHDGHVMRKTLSQNNLINQLSGFHNDMIVLKNIWFKRQLESEDHAARLEHFYSAQAHACEWGEGLEINAETREKRAE